MDLLFPLLILALLVPMFLGMRRQKKEAAKVTALQDSISGRRPRPDDCRSARHRRRTRRRDRSTSRSLDDVVTTWSRLVVREQIVDAPLQGRRSRDESRSTPRPQTTDIVREDRENGGDSTPRLNKD